MILSTISSSAMHLSVGDIVAIRLLIRRVSDVCDEKDRFVISSELIQKSFVICTDFSLILGILIGEN